MAESSIVTFRLKKSKIFGIYGLSVVTLVVVIALGYLSCYLFRAHQLWFHFTGLLMIVAFLLFIFTLWAIYRIHKEGRIGVIISDEGITDLSTVYYIGTVTWRDVEQIKVMDDLENIDYQYVVLVVKNPNQYIMQESSKIKKRSLMLKLHHYGSPVCISVRALDCTFAQLYESIQKYYRKAIR